MIIERTSTIKIHHHHHHHHHRKTQYLVAKKPETSSSSDGQTVPIIRDSSRGVSKISQAIRLSPFTNAITWLAEIPNNATLRSFRNAVHVACAATNSNKTVGKEIFLGPFPHHGRFSPFYRHASIRGRTSDTRG